MNNLQEQLSETNLALNREGAWRNLCDLSLRTQNHKGHTDLPGKPVLERNERMRPGGHAKVPECDLNYFLLPSSAWEP